MLTKKFCQQNEKRKNEDKIWNFFKSLKLDEVERRGEQKEEKTPTNKKLFTFQLTSAQISETPDVRIDDFYMPMVMVVTMYHFQACKVKRVKIDDVNENFKQPNGTQH